MSTPIAGLLIPFLGTVAGAGCVFFLRRELSVSIQRALTGFAAGVMVAASIWSLIVPAIQQSARLGRWAFLPAFLGFWLGILFLLLLCYEAVSLCPSAIQLGQKQKLSLPAPLSSSLLPRAGFLVASL